MGAASQACIAARRCGSTQSRGIAALWRLKACRVACHVCQYIFLSNQEGVRLQKLWMKPGMRACLGLRTAGTSEEQLGSTVAGGGREAGASELRCPVDVHQGARRVQNQGGGGQRSGCEAEKGSGGRAYPQSVGRGAGATKDRPEDLMQCGKRILFVTWKRAGQKMEGVASMKSGTGTFRHWGWTNGRRTGECCKGGRRWVGEKGRGRARGRMRSMLMKGDITWVWHEQRSFACC